MKPLFLLLLLFLCVACGPTLVPVPDPTVEPSADTVPAPKPERLHICEGDLRKIAFALVSSAENSTTDWASQYGYIEDIGDGRGYTAGIIGFCSGTGDMLDVVVRFTELLPGNVLEPFLPALRKVVGSESHEGLGDAFVSAWQQAALTPEMQQAQNDILDEQYMNPAMRYSDADSLYPLGQFVYYDALVMHGSGSDAESFEAIRRTALSKAVPPSRGGDEATFLRAFIAARAEVMKLEEAHADLSRLRAQEKFISEGNFCLHLPLSWTMYGDPFTLTSVP